MSGGVDSSVTALLLKQRGFDVHGAYMLNWDPQEEDEDGRCRANEDFADARKVCAQLHIPLHKVEFVREYWTDVFEPSMAAYGAGHTPNPDVLCNREIKFKRFLDLCRSRFGAHYIATGHYARVWRQAGTGKQFLMRGVDATKDQSYFLSNATEAALAQSLFPVGHLSKTQVRDMAQAAGFDWLATKKSSSGICFIGKRRFSRFVDKYITPASGLFRALDGTVLGRHEGITKYTIGQRARIPGRLDANKLYVVDKDVATNTVVVAEGADHPALLTDSLYASQLHWISGPPAALQEGQPLECEYQVGHLRVPARCRINPPPPQLLDAERQNSEEHYNNNKNDNDGDEAEPAQLHHVQFLDRPHWGVAPHQVIAFYAGPVCLGAGLIHRAGASYWATGQPVPALSSGWSI